MSPVASLDEHHRHLPLRDVLPRFRSSRGCYRASLAFHRTPVGICCCWNLFLTLEEPRPAGQRIATCGTVRRGFRSPEANSYGPAAKAISRSVTEAFICVGIEPRFVDGNCWRTAAFIVDAAPK